MSVHKNQYMPILKWRQGEYQALMRVKDAEKDKIFPLIVVPPIEYDFEEKRLKKTIQEHIEPLSKRIKDKWGVRPFFIDFHSSVIVGVMDSGNYVPVHIFSELRALGCTAIPVTNFERDKSYNNQVKSILLEDSRGFCLRVTLSQMMHKDFNSNVITLCNSIGVDINEVDLVLDLEEPDNFEPYTTFAGLIVAAINKVNRLDDYRSFILAGMSLKLSEIAKPGDEVPRHEWVIYKMVASLLNRSRIPTYGDYTIETPKFVNQDMRLMKPAGKIAYACDDTWLVPKGGAFRGAEQQMINHCNAIITSGKYYGAAFSFGDKRIEDTANGAQGCGNLSTWKQVGVNHHIETVVSQIANLHAASIAP